MTKASDDSQALGGYEVVVAVSGGIAAYKMCEVVSRLVQRGAGVTVAMTRAARRFVGEITFQALSGRRVLTSRFSSDHPQDVQHISLTAAADLMVVAPATADILGKIAAGIADDLPTTLVISAASPVLLAPAMNDRMWANPVVQHNVQRLTQFGFRFVGPAEGWLACRSVGPGRMAEPGDILDAIVQQLRSAPPKSAAGPSP